MGDNAELFMGDKELNDALAIAQVLNEWEETDRRGGNVTENLQRFECWR